MFNWSAFLLYIVVMSFTPGPNTILSTAYASKYGFKKSLEYSAGVFVGFFILMILSGYFNLLFFSIMPTIEPIMQVVGAAFMFYLAYKIMTSADEPAEDAEEVVIEEKAPSLFLTAVSFQFINPKGVLYAITVLSTFIIPYYQSTLSILGFTFLISTANLLSTMLWASFGSLFNKFLTGYQRPFNIAMGLFLVYSAVSMLGII